MQIMKLNFLTNKEIYIFLHALNASQHNEPFNGWADFTLEKWEKYPEECYFLAGFAEWSILNKGSIITVANKAEKLLKKWLQAPESRRLIRETKQYCAWLEKEWKEKEKKALQALESIIKMPLPNTEIFLYATHPKLRNGLAVSPTIIVYGHKEEWKNYSVVYLCHEILHTMFWGDVSEVTHAIIELATDQELRIRLNSSGKYFEFPCHSNLSELESAMLSDWRKYLKDENLDIEQFIQLQKKKAGALSSMPD